MLEIAILQRVSHDGTRSRECANENKQGKKKEGRKEGRKPGAMSATRWLVAAGLCVAAGLLMFPWVMQATVNGLAYWGPPELACQAGTSCRAATESTHYCERVVWAQYMRTPVNTFSNVMYMLSGVAVLVRALDVFWKAQEESTNHIQNHLRRCPAISVTIGIFLIFGGFGSFFCHASVTHHSREWDRAGIWAMFVPLIILVVLRFVPPPPAVVSSGTGEQQQPPQKVSFFGNGYLPYLVAVGAMWGSILLATLLHVLYGDTPFSTPIIYKGIPGAVAFILLLLVLRPFARRLGRPLGLFQSLPRLRSNYYILAVALPGFAIAYVLQDPARVGLCLPDGPWYVHTHGYWHILTGFGFLLTWWFGFSEQEIFASNKAETKAEAESPKASSFRRVSLQMV